MLLAALLRGTLVVCVQLQPPPLPASRGCTLATSRYLSERWYACFLMQVSGLQNCTSDMWMCLQPNWIDNVYRGEQDQASIEVSSFGYVHVGDVDNDGGYERKLISNMHDIGDDINRDVFAAENAATGEGNVRFTSVYYPRVNVVTLESNVIDPSDASSCVCRTFAVSGVHADAR